MARLGGEEMTALFWSAIALSLALLYVIVQIVRDYSRRNYLMAALGSVVTVVIVLAMSAPIETHAVMIDMAPPDTNQP